MAHTTEAGPASNTTTLLTALRVTSALTVVVIAFQFVTAGTLFGSGEGAEGLHSAGAIALHVVSGLAAIAAILLWRAGAPVWPAVLSALVFVLSFVQAYYGGRSSLYIHIPGAMVLTIGAVWVLAWSLTRAASTTRV